MNATCKHNLNEDVCNLINTQINKEYQMFYSYLQISNNLENEENYLPNASKFYKTMSDEEKEHGEMWSKYLINRGGKICLQQINTTEFNEHSNDLQSYFEYALEQEKQMNSSLLELHSKANDHNDIHLCNFIEFFFNDQVDAQRKLSNLINILNKYTSLGNDKYGEFHFDNYLKTNK